MFSTIIGLFSTPSRGFLLITGVAAVALLLTSCGSPRQTAHTDESLIWETWNLVKASYVDADLMDSEQVAGGIIEAMLEISEHAPYPFLTKLRTIKGRPPQNVPRELDSVWRAWTLLREEKSGVPPSILSGAGIRGLMASLSHGATAYFSPEEYQRALDATFSSYEGIGVFLSALNNRIIVSPIDGGPADIAGLLDGDSLVAVDGEPISAFITERMVSNALRGPLGSRIVLTIERPSIDGQLEFDFVRGIVEIPTVQVELLPGAIGYIFISEFRENTSLEVLDVLERLKQAEVLALILDIRNNPGGVEGSARDIASQFLPKGLFMYELDRKGNRTDWPIQEGGIATQDLPVAVIVNEFTTGIAEVFAGTLQDTGRATVLGVQTPGQASGNSFLELSDGSAISLAVSHWYTPTGTLMRGIGVAPDLEVPMTELDITSGIDIQLIEAYDFLDNLLPPFR